LGHAISKEGIPVDQEKVRAIRSGELLIMWMR